MALAASMLKYALTFGCPGAGPGEPDQEVVLAAQWEVTVALAVQLGVDRAAVDTSVEHPHFRVEYGGRMVRHQLMPCSMRATSSSSISRTTQGDS